MRAGSPSGDYWIFIRAVSPGDTFGYGIRVLTAPDSSYTGWTFGGFTTEPTTDLPTTAGGGNPDEIPDDEVQQLNQRPAEPLYFAKWG